MCVLFLQLYIHYAGEHQSEPVHGHKAESHISEGQSFLCETRMHMCTLFIKTDFMKSKIVENGVDIPKTTNGVGVCPAGICVGSPIAADQPGQQR